MDNAHKDELCRRLYDGLESFFPGLDITPHRYGKKTPYYIGTDGRHDGGNWTLFNGPNYGYTVISYSENKSISIIDFYAIKKGYQDDEAYKRTCELVGLETSKENEDYSRKCSLRTWVNERLTENLFNEKDEGAREVLEYMRGRGWTDDEVRKMGLGYMSREFRDNISRSPKCKELSEEFSSGRMEGETRIGIGDTHTLSIPYRNGSTIVGWNFRNIHAKTGTKYLLSKGAEKGTLSGVRYGGKFKECIIVEGDLDALHPQSKGRDNVYATTGGGVSDRQARDLKTKGYDTVILLFDNDERGRGFVGGSIDKLRSQGIKVFISNLPEDCKDTDEFLQTRSVDEWYRTVRNNAIQDSIYNLNEYLLKMRKEDYNAITRSRIISDFRDMILRTPLEDRGPLVKYIKELNYDGLGIDHKDLEIYFNEALSTLNEVKTRELLRTSTEEVGKLLDEGRVSDVIEKLSETLKQASYNTNGDYLAKVFLPYRNINEIYEELGSIKEGVPTGIEFGGSSSSNHFTIKEGLSFICGSQGHRKTTFLLNISLNEATRNIERHKLGGEELKKVLVISYEMSRDRVLSSLTNIYTDKGDISDSPYNTINGIIRGVYDSEYYTKERDEKGYYDELKSKITEFFNEYILTEAIKVVYLDNNTVGTLLDAIRYYRENTKGDISLVCIDYAQELTSENYSRQRTEEIKEIVNRVKFYANNERLPILMGAQFNRQVSSPFDLVPSNIGEGGDLERIAVDCVGVFYLRKLDVKESTIKNNLIKLLDGRCKGANVGDCIENNKPLRNLIYLKLMKSRYGDYPLDEVLEIHDKTGRIVVSKKGYLAIEPRQLDISESFPTDLSIGGTSDSTCPF